MKGLLAQTPLMAKNIGPKGITGEISSRIVTQSKIRCVVRHFDPFKAAREANILPALIQKGLDVFMGPICTIFRAV